MYGDTEVLRRRVDQLREQAVDIRGLADQLAARTGSIRWTGRAADSMRIRVTERATHLRRAAAQHETAADSLDGHLHQVQTQQEAIAAVARRAHDLVSEARTRLADIATRNDLAATDGAGHRVAPDTDDVTLDAFDPPADGHRDWLAVELPGLS